MLDIFLALHVLIIHRSDVQQSNIDDDKVNANEAINCHTHGVLSLLS